jgi:hypothetical protein
LYAQCQPMSMPSMCGGCAGGGRKTWCGWELDTGKRQLVSSLISRRRNSSIRHSTVPVPRNDMNAWQLSGTLLWDIWCRFDWIRGISAKGEMSFSASQHRSELASTKIISSLPISIAVHASSLPLAPHGVSIADRDHCCSSAVHPLPSPSSFLCW